MNIETPAIRINLGAGHDIQQSFTNLDILPLPGIDVVHNLNNYPWPFEDQSASEIRAIDVIEHMPNFTHDDRPGVIAFVEECWRILEPGGLLFIQTPGVNAAFAWTDPTHVRTFTRDSFDFFDPTTDFGKATGFYSYCTFKVDTIELENGNLQARMVKLLDNLPEGMYYYIGDGDGYHGASGLEILKAAAEGKDD